VQMCHQVTQLAVRMDEIERAELRPRRRGTLGRPRRRCYPVLREEVCTVPPVHRQLESGEEEAPALVDGAWIVLPAAILIRDVVLVGEREAFETIHGSIVLLAGVRGDGHPLRSRGRRLSRRPA